MIVVTGATGQLGRLVVEELLQAGVPAGEIVAAVRSPQKAEALRAKGVQVRQADYSRPETLGPAFAGADKVLLISSSEVGQRRAQHRAVVDGAKAAGVRFLAYTSILNADRATNLLAEEHRDTELYIEQSGLPYALLRNGWYTENHTMALGAAVQHDVVLGASGDGRFAVAARRDYAKAAARVLSGTGHENKVYELGSNPYTKDELAAEVARVSGKPVVYRDLPVEEYAAALGGFGLPEAAAKVVADADAGAARGELTTSSRDLETLLGRAAQTMPEAVHTALAG